MQPGQVAGNSLGPKKTTYNDDIIAGWVGIGSQLDGLGHIGIDNVYYNCNKAADFVKADGLRQTRHRTSCRPSPRARIVLDMAGFFGTDIVKEGTAFNRVEIEGALQRQGVTGIERGDVVLFYTGWTQLIGKDDKRYAPANRGSASMARKYLASIGVAMVGADTWGLEVIPFETNAGVYEVHQILLPMHGIYILENMSTEEMVQDKAWESSSRWGPHASLVRCRRSSIRSRSSSHRPRRGRDRQRPRRPATGRPSAPAVPGCRCAGRPRRWRGPSAAFRSRPGF